jgi:hypothetical protein
MRAAREHFGKSAALLIALEGEGIRSRGGERYTEATVSKWVLGQTVPPSDVLLTAARLAGVRVDAYLYQEEARETDQEDKRRLDRLENELARLSLLVARLARTEEEHESGEEHESDERASP